MLAPQKSLLAFKGEEKWIFTISLCLHALVLLPILIADRFNVDDWGRSTMGYWNWGLDGRPLTDLIVIALDLGRPLVDFSPISQIGSILCLSWLSTIVARRFQIKRPLVAALATLPFGANPFFLANLSFKFDSLPMVLSLAFALIPILTAELSKPPNRTSLFFGALSLLASLCIYQASLHAFLVVVCLEIVFSQKSNETPTTILSLVKGRILQLLPALIVYKIVVLFTIHEPYSVEHSALVSGSGAISNVFHNLVTFWSFSLGMLTGTLRSTLLFPIALALLASIAIGLRYAIKTATNFKLLWIAGAFATPILMLFGVFVLLIFLKSPTGGARTFVGFGALIASSLIIITSILTELAIPGELQCFLFGMSAYTMIGFAAIYGNATKAQKKL
jgi:hypothetical protein